MSESVIARTVVARSFHLLKGKEMCASDLIPRDFTVRLPDGRTMGIVSEARHEGFPIIHCHVAWRTGSDHAECLGTSVDAGIAALYHPLLS
jgi:hypothetical protein